MLLAESVHANVESALVLRFCLRVATHLIVHSSEVREHRCDPKLQL